MTEAIENHQTADEAPRRLAGQNRLRLIGILFTGAFLTIAGQLTHLTIFPKPDDGPVRPIVEGPMPRPDIIDRNGVLLATDVAVASIFADPSKIIDIDEAVEALTATMPDLDARELRRKLVSTKHFAWIKRQVSPEERDAVYNLGIPGVSYVNERRRVYPQGRLSSHVVGYVDLDTKGIAGIEKYLDDRGALYTASLAEPTEHRTEPRCSTRYQRPSTSSMPSPAAASSWTSTPEKSSPWFRCRISIRTRRTRTSPRTSRTA